MGAGWDRLAGQEFALGWGLQGMLFIFTGFCFQRLLQMLFPELRGVLVRQTRFLCIESEFRDTAPPPPPPPF